jgi:putative ABC transport system ATP-binding protein
MVKSIIRLENVSKIYQLEKVKVEALRGVDLDIKQKEFVSIIGASGSGKSTLLHLIGTLDRPTTGNIFLGGVDISRMKGDELARLRGERIGFIFQFFNLYPTLTTQENVELPMVIHEVGKNKRQERAAELLENIGLGNRTEHYPAELSGGERQRVAIARALANDPGMILADEPTGNLDSKTGIEIMKIFAQLNHEGKTIVMVTHEKNIANYSERLIIVKDGKILRDGDKNEKICSYFSSGCYGFDCSFSFFDSSICCH